MPAENIFGTTYPCDYYACDGAAEKYVERNREPGRRITMPAVGYSVLQDNQNDVQETLYRHSPSLQDPGSR